MGTKTRKICLVGDFGVGKTSLVRRFVNQTYSDEYITTVGVKVDSRSIELEADVIIKLLIWDIAGQDNLSTITTSYLQGAQGYLLVADGTRADTFDSALRLRQQVVDQLGNIPSFGFLNKIDLYADWCLDDDVIKSESSGITWQKSSALTGDGVEETFLSLARALT